jgi:sodium/bile acid cotransporter 7
MERLLARIDRFSAALLATVLVASLLPCRGEVATGFRLLTGAAIALLFFLHGAKLSRAAIVEGATNWRLHLLVLALTFALFPLLGLGAQAVAGLMVAPALAAGMLFLALLPSTVQSSIAFTTIAGGNVPAAVCSASASNLIGIVLTPLLVAATMSGASGHVSGGEVETIALQLLLPFVAGHLSRPLTAGFVARHKALVSLVDRGSILLVVYTAFSAAVVEGLWHQVPAWQLAVIVLLSLMLLAIVMIVARTAARRLGFDRADEIAILFCGSKKSLASGVPMAGVLFPAAQVGAIILPLMIFHQLQLLACASIAQRYARRAPAAATIDETVEAG